MIYEMPALARSGWPSPLAVGAIPTATQISNINRAATVLTNLRWSSTVGFPFGGTFASGTIAIFVPASSTGRWTCECIVQAPTKVTMTGLRVQKMSGSNYYSNSITTNIFAEPTDLRGTSNGLWRCSSLLDARAGMNQLATDGCPRVQAYGVTGETPLGMSFFAYPAPDAWQTASDRFAGWRNDGTLTPSWADGTNIPSLSAAWARAIATEIEVAEAMPIIIGMLPLVSGLTGLAAWDAALLRRVMTKRIPLARGRRPKALYFAFSCSTTPTPNVDFQIGGQEIYNWTTIYSSGVYRVLKATLSDDAYQSVGVVGGVPIVKTRLKLFSLVPTGATAWISEDF